MCPKDDIQNMTLFLYFYISRTRFSIRHTLSVLCIFYKPHLTSVHDVRKVQPCVVVKSDVGNDVHNFTNPGGASIPFNVVIGQRLPILDGDRKSV